MTLPALLRRVGVHVPRYVTVDGAIVLDRSTTSATQVNNTPVTEVSPHRFHGGEDPSPERGSYPNAWWNVDPSAKAADIEDMTSRFSQVTVLDDNGQLDYGIVIDTGRGRFGCLIMPHVDRSLPSVHVVQPTTLGRNQGRYFRKPPHLYTSGALCIADCSDWNGKNYPTSVAVGWTAHWLACYTEWRMTGVWPTEGYGVVAA